MTQNTPNTPPDRIRYQIMGPDEWSDARAVLVSTTATTGSTVPETAFLDLCKAGLDETGLLRALLNVTDASTGEPVFRIGCTELDAKRTYEVRIDMFNGAPLRVEIKMTFDVGQGN